MKLNSINPVRIIGIIGLSLIILFISACGPSIISTSYSNGIISTICRCGGRTVDCEELEALRGTDSCPRKNTQPGGITLSCAIPPASCSGIPNACSQAQSICACPSGGALQCTNTSVTTSTIDLIYTLTNRLDSENLGSVYLSVENNVRQTTLYDNNSDIKEISVEHINNSLGGDSYLNFYQER